MIKSFASFYGTLLRGLVVLAVASAISQARVFEAQETARKSVKQVLVSLSKLNEKVVDPRARQHLHSDFCQAHFSGFDKQILTQTNLGPVKWGPFHASKLIYPPQNGSTPAIAPRLPKSPICLHDESALPSAFPT
jgi:hypothetical protein